MAYVEIYQLAHECETTIAWAHGGYAYAMGNGFDPSYYKMVHACEDASGSLASIYAEFNGELPKGYRGRPLGVGDVVVINGMAYYCDNQGFAEIPRCMWHDRRAKRGLDMPELIAA